LMAAGRALAAARSPAQIEHGPRARKRPRPCGTRT
jgi:hypothetical protein